MATTLDALTVELSADVKGLQSGLSSAAGSVQKFTGGAQRELSSLQASLMSLRTAVFAVGGAWAAWSAGRQIVDAGVQMQALENRMRAAVGSAEIAASAMQYLREESERLGLRFSTTAEGFANFSASALRAGLTLEQTKNIFTGVSEAAAALQLSPERVGFVFMALSQMASKGKVSLEELSQQLGESLPGALSLFASAMGKTQPEFMKMVENGEVTVADLSKLGDRLHTEFGDKAEDAAQGAQAAFNRLENALFDLKAKLSNAGILDAVTKGVIDLTQAINDPQVQAGLINLAQLIAQVASAAVQAASSIGNLASKANSFVEGGGNKIFSAIGGQEGVSALQRARSRKSNESTFQDRMVQKYIDDFQAANPSPAKSEDGSYTLGKLAPPDNSKALKGAESARKKAERAAEVARRKAQREAEQQARERESLSGQVRDMGVSMGTDPEKYRADLEDQHKILEEALAKKAITQKKFNDMTAQTEQAYRDRLKEYFVNEYGTEAEQEQLRYEEKQEKLTEALEQKLVTEEEYRRLSEELEQAHQNKLTDIKEKAAEKEREIEEKKNQLISQSKERLLDSSLGLMQVFANKNKAIALAMLAFEKARAIAEAVIATELAAAKALAIYGPTPQGIAAAGLARTLGYANVAVIAATGIAQAAQVAIGSSSSGKPGAAGTTFNSSTGQYEQATSAGTNNIVINLQGSDTANFTKTQVRELIAQINDATKDGTRLNLVTVS